MRRLGRWEHSMVGAMQPARRSLQGDREPHPRVSFCSIREWLSTSAVSHGGETQPHDHGLTSTALRVLNTNTPTRPASGCCQRARPGRLPRWPCPPCLRVPGPAMEPLPGNVRPDVCTRCPHMHLRMLSQPWTEGKAAWLGSLCKC